MALAYGGPTPPDPTLSRYVSYATNSALCDMGEDIGIQQAAGTVDPDAFVILHMHAPMVWGNGDFGSSLGANVAARIDGTGGIKAKVKKYADCYQAVNPGGSTLKIVVGVTSDEAGPDSGSSSVFPQAQAQAHGYAWGQMIVYLNSWASAQGFGGQVSFNGGMDAEYSFNLDSSGNFDGSGATLNQVKNWENGYRSGNDAWNLMYYGDASSCPSDYRPSNVCDWNGYGIMDLAWLGGETTAFPQIYDEPDRPSGPPTSLNAQQWAKLSWRVVSVYGMTRINFSGGLSQKAACGTGCSGTALGPKDSYRNLWDEINCSYDEPGTECVTTDSLRWTTNITDKQTL